MNNRINKTFSALILMVMSFTLASQQTEWGPAMDVADGFGNMRPRIELDVQGKPLVLFGKVGAAGKLYLAKGNGSGFDAPVQVHPDGVTPFISSWAGPDMAVSGENVWVIFDADMPWGFMVYVVKSMDGGQTFGDTVAVSSYNGVSRFATIAADENDNVIAMFMDHDAGYANPRYVSVSTDDGGNTWNLPVDGSSAVSGSEVCDCCPAKVAIQDNLVNLMFRNNNNDIRDIWLSVSSDGGNSYPNASDIDPESWSVSGCPSTGPDAFYRGDSIIMSYMSNWDGQSRVYVTSANKNTTFAGQTEMISAMTTFSVQNYPRIAGNDYLMGVVYQDNKQGNNDCYLAVDFNGDLRPDSTGMLLHENLTGYQINPDVAFRNNVFHTVYQDNYSGNPVYRTFSVTPQNIQDPSGEFSKVQIVPNPADDHFYLSGISESLSIVNLQILDLNGKLIRELKAFNPATDKVALDRMVTGQYILNIMDEVGSLLISKSIIVN